MATVTITITDEDEGDVKIRMVCDPPINMKDNDKNTAAHAVGVEMLEAAQKQDQ